MADRPNRPPSDPGRSTQDDSTGEDELLSWLRHELKHRGKDFLGQDTANLGPLGTPQEDELVVTVDQHIEEVHLPAGTPPAVWARRLLAVNMSDLAAAGAIPWRAFLAVCAPRQWDHRSFFSEFLRLAGSHGLHLAGGDLASGPTVHLSLTLLGRCRRGAWLNRKGAAPGDGLWLGGPLGLGALGLALLGAGVKPEFKNGAVKAISLAQAPAVLREAVETDPLLHELVQVATAHYYGPEPQLELGGWLSQQQRVAVMDLSDGLGQDLPRWAQQSAVGATIERTLLPLRSGYKRLCDLIQRRPYDLAVSGGDDYVLLFSLPDGESPPAAFACTKIGEVTRSSSVRIVTPEGTRALAGGWDHLAQ